MSWFIFCVANNNSLEPLTLLYNRNWQCNHNICWRHFYEFSHLCFVTSRFPIISFYASNSCGFFGWSTQLDEIKTKDRAIEALRKDVAAYKEKHQFKNCDGRSQKVCVMCTQLQYDSTRLDADAIKINR